MIDHIAAIVVMLPIISSVFVMLIRNNSINWLISTTASLITSIASIMMYLQISKNGIISYAMGGWEPPLVLNTE